jgi:hypothetical protein
MLEHQMVEDGSPDTAHVGFGRRDVALNVARRKTVDQIGKPVEREQPCKEEVPTPPSASD